MSEQPVRCGEIDQWFFEPGSKELPDRLSEHVENCDGCREQVRIHQSLIVVLAEDAVPNLSGDFDADLERKLAAARVEVRPLAGWRKAAMITYGTAAAGVLGWALRDVPLPTIDPSAPWVPVAIFVAVPLTLLLAVAASRWLPAPRAKLGPMAFGL